MSHFEFYATLTAFAAAIIFLAFLFWARVKEKLAAHKKYIDGLVRVTVHKRGDEIPFKQIMQDENIWIVTGDHPQLGRPDQGGLSDEAAKQYARELEQMGYENVRFIKQN